MILLDVDLHKNTQETNRNLSLYLMVEDNLHNVTLNKILVDISDIAKNVWESSHAAQGVCMQFAIPFFLL